MNIKTLDDIIPHLTEDPVGIELRILNSMSEMLIFHDKELKIQWANDAACRSVNLGCGQIIGKNCYEVWQNDKNPCTNCPLLKVLKTGESCEANIKSVKGRTFNIRGYPVFDSNSQIIGLLEYKEDITDRIKMEETLKCQNSTLLHKEKIIREKDELLTNIIQYLPDATFAVNKEGIIIAWNQAMETISRKSSHDMVGSSELSIITRMYEGVHPPLYTLLLPHNKDQIFEFPSVTQNGNTLESEIFSHSFTKSGSFIWIISAPIYNSLGEIIGYIESIRDITDRKKAEELAARQDKEQELRLINEQLHTAYEELSATEEELRANYEEHLVTEQELRESEKKFRSLVEFSLESILIIDMQGTILFANQALADLIELKDISSLAGRNVMEFITPKSHADVINDFSQVLQGIDGFISEYQVSTARGNIIYIESIGKSITYHGQPADLLSVHDITTRKKHEEELRYQNEVISKTYNELSQIEENLRNNYNELVNKEQKLRESEERFKVIFSIVPDPIILTRITDGKIIECNQALIELVGLSYEKILGKSTLDFCVWKNEKDRQEFLYELTNTGSIDKKELLWQNNKKEDINILFSSRIIEINKEKIIISVGFDYTNIKRAKDLLRESEEMFRNPVENSPVGVFLYQDGFFRYSNKHLAMMFGYPREKLLNTSIEKLFPSSDIQRIRENIHNIDNNQPSESYLEIQGIKSDGTILDLELYASTMQFNGNNAIYGTIIDITSKKLAEKLRQSSEKKYRLITEHMKDVVWILDINSWYFSYVSPSVKRLLGFTAEEILEKPFSHTLDLEVYKNFIEIIETNLNRFISNPSQKDFFITELQQRCKDGTSVTTEVITNFFINQDTERVELLGVTRDISDRKRYEKEIERKTLELYQINEDLYATNEELSAIEEERKVAYEELSKNQKALITSEQALKKAQYIAHLGIWQWDLASNKIYISTEFTTILGLKHIESPPTFKDLFSFPTHEYRELFENSMNDLLDYGKTFTLDLWIIRKDGLSRAIRGQGEFDGNVHPKTGQLTLIIQDITSQKLMEEEIKEASLEKEILLREIHHRVKNNMQVISSLLSMQSRTIKEPTVQLLFKETQTRVRTLALVHELLYQSDKLNKINYSLYLQKISSYLYDSYQISQGSVSFIIQANNLELSIDKAVPCSLIITELLTNSLKYAFSDGRKGEILITLLIDEEKQEYILDYRDNGTGFPHDHIYLKGSGFGKTLINGLVRQLSGNIQIDSGDNGVHYMINFPTEEKEMH